MYIHPRSISSVISVSEKLIGEYTNCQPNNLIRRAVLRCDAMSDEKQSP